MRIDTVQDLLDAKECARMRDLFGRGALYRADIMGGAADARKSRKQGA